MINEIYIEIENFLGQKISLFMAEAVIFPGFYF